MCCFSRKGVEVSGTQIFARMVAPGRQILAYQLTLASKDEVAMVLPLPVASAKLSFIDLSKHATLFADLASLFVEASNLRSLGRDAEDTLAVERVGAFDASFVPTRADFG